MIYISTENLRPGMKLARAVWGRNSFLPLFHAGVSINDRGIALLLEKEVSGAYVEMRGTESVEYPDDLFPMEEKVRLADDIKSITLQLLNSKNSIFKTVKAFDRVVDSVTDVILNNEECMLNLVDIKSYNDYAYVHSLQVGILSALIGKKLEFSEDKLKNLTLAAVLHDVGKLNVPKAIVEKSSALTAEEFNLMKRHPEYAFQRLSQCSTLSKSILDGIACHHEKYDGTGYPYGLVGNDIPVFGRIISIADVYDALTSPRTYRAAWTPHETINYMMCRAGTQFDTNILRTFLSIVAAYPIGVMVDLDNDMVGIVLKTHPGFPLNPTIKILYPPQEKGKIIDLANDMDALTLRIVSTVTDSQRMASILCNNSV